MRHSALRLASGFSVLMTVALPIAATEAGELTIGGNGPPYLAKTVEVFQQMHPEITVKHEPGTQSIDNGSLQALIQSGAGPDILLVNSGPARIGGLVRDKLIRPLDDLYANGGLAARYQDDIIAKLKSQNGGTLYEAVEGVDVFQIYYSEALFAQHGLTPPTTWQEFLDLCQKLKDAGVKPIALGMRNNFAGGWLVGQLLQSAAGKAKMDQVFLQGASMDDPDVVAGFAGLKDLIDRGYIDGGEALALGGDEAMAGFFNQQYGMMAMSEAQPPTIQAQSGVDLTGIKAFTLPSQKADEPAIPTAGMAVSWVVSANSDADPKDIAAWFDFVSSDAYRTAAINNGMIFIPTTKGEVSGNVTPILGSAIATLANGVGYNPSVWLAGNGTAGWYSALQAVAGGSMTPEQAAAAVETARKQ